MFYVPTLLLFENIRLLPRISSVLEISFSLDSFIMADEEFHDFYKYTPSKAAAITFIVLFLISSVIHLFQIIRGRVLFFIPLFIGGIFEIVGFGGRIISSTEAPLFTDTPYIIQNLFLLLAPALFAASIYMQLGRLIILLGAEHHSIVRRSWMTKIFVTGDILSFVVQGLGGGIMASGKPSNLSLGEKIVVVGLIIQILFFGFFIVVSVIIHLRMRTHPTTASLSLHFSWRKYLYSLYVVSTLVMIRSIFRVAEFAQGTNGTLLKQEYYLYIFDATLMFILMVTLNVIHPGVISTLVRGKIALKGSENLKMQSEGRRSNEQRGCEPMNLCQSFAESIYARHAIATRGLA
ncbi:RTA1 domain protein, putative [Trichophyton benhamiae CBS 112371]|uniref:RTA1 domain protein, putative n=1 Tax=Arthroderma benhamiae (strain ATCC MYA-4681 / CBS 112371) TaxID=663331 RepID=D4AZR7_ARTBC|nr:RTA1 domain protein, putative [Trichophyton benhamiae CBS 112371]EFE31537.1 RTA1 domain protein, putative [Trichophyton benhamiae CBS 112371]